MKRSTEILSYISNIAKTRRHYSSNAKQTLKDHPYSNIHPWESQREFSRYLLKNIIYNNDGLVVINKPYGISIYETTPLSMNTKNNIANAKDYTIKDSLEYLSRKLDYSNLNIIKSPEKYMTGVTILSAGKKTTKKFLKSFNFQSYKLAIPITYWIVTSKLPKEVSGEKYFAIGRKQHDYDKTLSAKSVLTEWSINAVKRQEVVPFRVRFKLLSNSTDNLASLIEVKISKRQWYSIRQFATHFLHSPILGDNIYGYLIQKVMDSYVNVGLFSPLKDTLPVLHPNLLNVLNLKKKYQEIIPVHIHMRQVHLYKYLGEDDLILEAPLMPEFQWTCDRLQFKYLKPEEKKETKDEELLDEQLEQQESRL